MHLLIDSDSLLYKAGFVANGEGDGPLACWQLDQMLTTLIDETGCSSYQCYISGSNNFRNTVYQDYKANRKDMVRPVHLNLMKEHMVVRWHARVSDGREADDEVGIAQWCAEDETCIAHIDKDIDMIPGFHYNYNKKESYAISEEQAMRTFFYQLIMGDRGDNIPGFDGKMRATVPKKLQAHVDYLHETTDEDEMLAHVASMYGDWDRLNLSARLLWIHRCEEDDWRNWQNPALLDELRTMEGYGLGDALTASSQVFSDQAADDGNLNTPF